MEQKPNKFEVLLWSIFLPGLGQILNQKLVKGFVLVILVIIVNYKSKLNLVIFSSFNGELSKAILMTDYQWLLFCPCLYMFAIWDAYKEAEGEVSVPGYIPFVMTAYFAVVGLIFSSTLEVFGRILGPFYMTILFAIIGILMGLMVRRIAINIIHRLYKSK